MIVWLRSFLYALGMLLLTPLFSVIALLTFPFHPLTRSRIIAAWAKIMLWWARLVCGLQYRVIGAENIPATPVVILSKHQSAWETLAFQCIFPPRGLGDEARTAENPVLRLGAGHDQSDRDRPRRRQGGAEADHRAGRGKAGTGILGGGLSGRHAGQAGEQGEIQHRRRVSGRPQRRPVLPVAHNAGEFWGKNAFLKYPGTITLSIGKPIHTAGMKAGALNAAVEAWIEGEMQRIAHDYEGGPLAPHTSR